MNFQLPPDAILRDVLAPRSLIADAGAFGGARKGEFLRGFADYMLKRDY